MIVAFVALLQIGQFGTPTLRAPPRGSNLGAAAISSVRPRECASRVSSSRQNAWESVRDARLADYCEALARGFGELALAPKAALQAADAADRASEGHASPWVLRARAHAQLGDWAAAGTAFARAVDLDAQSVEEPATMHIYADTLARAGHVVEALAVYRALGPKVSLLSAPSERARTFLEGAEVALALGPSALDDAIAFLFEARHLGVAELEWRITSSLALALDRAGRTEEAKALLVALARHVRASRFKVDKIDVEKPSEMAASAFALETIDPRRAAALWEQYVNLGHAPFLEHAEKRLEGLRRRGR